VIGDRWGGTDDEVARHYPCYEILTGVAARRRAAYAQLLPRLLVVCLEPGELGRRRPKPGERRIRGPVPASVPADARRDGSGPGRHRHLPCEALAQECQPTPGIGGSTFSARTAGCTPVGCGVGGESDDFGGRLGTTRIVQPVVEHPEGGTPDRCAEAPAIRPARAARLVLERRTLPRSPSLGVLGRPSPPSLPSRRLPGLAPAPPPRRHPGRAREPQLPDRPRRPHPSSRRLREPRRPGRKVRERQRDARTADGQRRLGHATNRQGDCPRRSLHQR